MSFIRGVEACGGTESKYGGVVGVGCRPDHFKGSKRRFVKVNQYESKDVSKMNNHSIPKAENGSLGIRPPPVGVFVFRIVTCRDQGAPEWKKIHSIKFPLTLHNRNDKLIDSFKQLFPCYGYYHPT